MSKIQRIFVANRGEICRRIGLTASRLGISTVMISESERLPEFLSAVIADFIHVKDLTARSYLDMDRMIGYAKELKADSVHPGYGFLSENADFARAVIRAGMNWIGPNPDAIDQMASKAKAREIATRASVPCLPALEGIDVQKEKNLEQKLRSFADQQGFPLLIKAAYGGGGKGMRMVHQESELLVAAERAASEAVNAFGNGLIIVEPYVTAPRHVEVQIMADRHGDVRAIGDRDCSVQRRHQKIIEESPAPGLTAKTRQAMAEAAVELARRVGYDSAGTVEFLVDWSSKSRSSDLQKFYFLEMNTRLQVEHPVTEEVHRIDLVAAQIRVAQGEKMSSIPHRPVAEGHSIEIRVYAEDCESNFMPSPGYIHYFKPYQEAGLRWEIGVDSVDQVSANFDPMIAKLVATASDRESAIRLMVHGIENSSLIGPKNNLAYLREIFERTPFRTEPVTTGFIPEHQAKIIERMQAERAKLQTELKPSAEFIQDAVQLKSKSSSQSNELNLRTQDIFGSATSKTQQSQSPIEVWSSKLHPARANGQTVTGRAWVEDLRQSVRAVDFAVTTSIDGVYSGISCLSHNIDRFVPRRVASSGSLNQRNNDTSSPVPGKVVAILVKEGDSVQEAQTLFVLESMKMEFEVKAARAGVISKIHVHEKQQVESGTVLAAWES